MGGVAVGRTADKAAQVLARTGTRPIIYQSGFYIADGFKISEAYYTRLWAVGRPAPFLQAREIINSKPTITPDPGGMQGFLRYESAGLEMIYNPTTKEIFHIQPIKK
jgi:filamentous hemagglutinin